MKEEEKLDLMSPPDLIKDLRKLVDSKVLVQLTIHDFSFWISIRDWSGDAWKSPIDWRKMYDIIHIWKLFFEDLKGITKLDTNWEERLIRSLMIYRIFYDLDPDFPFLLEKDGVILEDLKRHFNSNKEDVYLMASHIWDLVNQADSLTNKNIDDLNDYVRYLTSTVKRDKFIRRPSEDLVKKYRDLLDEEYGFIDNLVGD